MKEREKELARGRGRQMAAARRRQPSVNRTTMTRRHNQHVHIHRRLPRPYYTSLMSARPCHMARPCPPLSRAPLPLSLSLSLYLFTQNSKSSCVEPTTDICSQVTELAGRTRTHTRHTQNDGANHSLVCLLTLSDPVCQRVFLEKRRPEGLNVTED